ncbi:TetR family transcriptional regulator [Frondihabitans sp. PhB188]|uniref:TetR/AcrR family transcriptional regulator n=1 Tax=Frondihabitans sp. PhB188 TaxID=2485200 RepID=UPI000F4AB76D|nr:TetR/AcrR family transcriptional regulator [Frondihabitans sp. PhB188]ROQ38660.1 TetR family transcriptional regulator [Frondihabitans sp. PhB188]
MSVPGAQRGAYAKTAQRRREILMAGFAVFASSGYRSGSIREISDRVGMSQAGLLHHFPSKSDLLAGVLELRDEDARSRVPLDVDAGIETIRGLAELTDYNATIRGLVELHCVLSAEATSAEHPAHAYFVNRYQWSVGMVTTSLEVMQRTGQLVDGVDPAGSARALIALMDGLQVQWLLDSDSVDMGVEVRRYLQSLMTVPLEP